MLLAVSSPNSAFFACAPDFNFVDGWMRLAKNIVYKLYLGEPHGEAVVARDGLVTRAFDGANVSLNISSFVPARNPTDGGLNRGCVRWASGDVTGVCP